jgi:hypothetical protein
MRRLLAGVLVAGAAGLCAGCGSDGGSSSTAGAASSITSVTTVVPGTTTTTAPTTTVTVPPSAPTTTATTPATPAGDPEKAAYIAKADVVCAAGNAAVRKLNERANKVVRGQQEDETKLLKALAPILRDGRKIQTQALRQFKAIPPPAADRALITRYWGLLDQQLELLGQMVDAAVAGDVDAYKRITTKSSALRDQSRALAKAYGYKRCGTEATDAS